MFCVYSKSCIHKSLLDDSKIVRESGGIVYVVDVEDQCNRSDDIVYCHLHSKYFPTIFKYS